MEPQEKCCAGYSAQYQSGIEEMEKLREIGDRYENYSDQVGRKRVFSKNTARINTAGSVDNKLKLSIYT